MPDTIRASFIAAIEIMADNYLGPEIELVWVTTDGEPIDNGPPPGPLLHVALFCEGEPIDWRLGPPRRSPIPPFPLWRLLQDFADMERHHFGER